MIIDAHYHLYPFGPDWPLAAAAEQDHRTRLKALHIDPDRQIEAVLEKMDATGVQWLGMVNAFHHPSITVPCPNEVFARAIAPYPDRFFGWAGFPVHPTPDLDEIRRAVLEYGFRGLKFIPPTQWFAPDDFELMSPVYELAIELGVPTIWHFGPGPFRLASRTKFGDLEAMNEVCFRYPELRVLIAHAGDLRREDLATALCQFPNVYIEASVLTHHLMTAYLTPSHEADAAERHKRDFLGSQGTLEPSVQAAWDRTRKEHRDLIWKIANRAPKKFIFASDGPNGARMDFCVQEYREAFSHDPLLMEDIFWRNAQRLLNLPVAEPAIY